jgi:Raf kinase inhibitor-like YbhB/YbcL family protein
MQRWNVIMLAFGLALLAGCGGKSETSKPSGQPTATGEPTAHKTFVLRSEAFRNGETIPADFRHTEVGGKNQSPPLEWTDPPSGTRAFALVCIDPDAPDGEFVHWVLYNLPGELRKLERNLGRTPALPNGARQGKNDFDEIGYDGPAPPPGKPHRYIFRLYALDRPLDLPPQATRQQLEKAMQGHILAQTELVGIYEHE